MSVSREKKEWTFFWIASVLLVFMAIFLSYLIFWGRSGYLAQEPTQAQTQDAACLLDPENLYLSIGAENTFVKVPSGTGDYQGLTALALSLMQEELPQLSVVDVIEGFEVRLPVDETVLVMDLGFTADAEMVRSELSLTGGRFPEGTFDQIWIRPSRSLAENICFYFFNSDNGSIKMAEGGLYSQTANQALLLKIIEVYSGVEADWFWHDGSGSGAYTSVKAGAYASRLTGYEFLTTSTREYVTYGTLKSLFTEADGVDVVRMRRYGMSFFEYPDTVTQQMGGLYESSDQVLLLTNEKITLRLFPDGRLTYIETLTDQEKSTVPFAEAYDIAARFLSEDLARTTGTDLTAVFAACHQEGDQLIFEFDYRLNGTAIQMDPVLIDRWNMEHPVRITVQGSKVRAYERYVAGLTLGREGESLYNWIQVIDRCVEEGLQPQAMPVVVYQVSYGQLYPMWQVKTKEGLKYFFI